MAEETAKKGSGLEAAFIIYCWPKNHSTSKSDMYMTLTREKLKWKPQQSGLNEAMAVQIAVSLV